VGIKFRKYQKRMIKAQDAFMKDPETTRGTILAATGAGKTEVFINLVEKTIIANGNNARILIVHPRIALSQDQQGRFGKRFPGVELTSFHSGQQSTHTLADRKNVSVIQRDKLQEVIDSATTPHITFSSYKSLHRIASMDFDVIICDEAHYLVQSDLRENLHLFKSKTLFYTGTPVEVAAQEESMDNTDLFGEVIVDVPPSELIPFGYIVPPRIRTINVQNKKIGNTIDYVTTIGHAFKDQLSLVHTKFTQKMLVAMPRTTEFDEIMQELADIRTIVGRFDIDVYFITADRSVKNGSAITSREMALRDFDNNPKPCIIIHCDTLAEGIDVDGIGGVLLLRGLGMTKTIQTMGRGCRAAKADIRTNGEIKKRKIKTECIVTLARVDGEWCGDNSVSDWSELFRVAGYGDIWDFYEPGTNERGPSDEERDADDVIFDEIRDIKITEGADKLWNKLFGEETNA